MRLESDLFIGMTMISFLDAVWRVIELRYIGSIEHKWIAEGAILGHIYGFTPWEVVEQRTKKSSLAKWLSMLVI